MGRNKQFSEDPFLEEVIGSSVSEERSLVLHNDEIHTFDYVIDSLVKVCDMELLQAEQCTYLVHYKGKCDIKKGNFNYLKPYKSGLTDRGLKATID